MKSPPSEFIRGFLYLLVYTIRYKINLFSRKHKRKSPKTYIKEKYSNCMVEVFREKFWRLGDKVLSLPSDSKTNNQTEL
jgi:hypothetical protein